MFGLPGDYVLGFYAQLEKSPLNVVGCTREDCAGFATDNCSMTLERLAGKLGPRV